jgi:hypothetical protein
MQLLVKRTLMVLLWLHVASASSAQQILKERILSWPATQLGFVATGLLRVQPDSLRLLGNFQGTQVLTSAQQSTRISLRRVLTATCDTLPVRGAAFQVQAVASNSSTGLATRAGRVLISNWYVTNLSSPIGLHLLARNGLMRWQQTLPSPTYNTTVNITGLLEAPDRGFFVAVQLLERTYLARLDSLGTILWQKTIGRRAFLGPSPFAYDPVYTPTGNLLFHCIYSNANTTGVLEVSQNGDSLTTHPTSPNPLLGSIYPAPGLNPLIPLRAGGYLVAADVDSANGYSRPFLTRLDQNMNIVWSTIYRQNSTQQYRFSHPYELADGSLVVLANSANGYPTTYYLFRYSAAGVLLQRYPFTSPLIAGFPNTGFTQPVGLQPLSDSTFMLVSNLRSYVANGQQVQRTYLAHLKVAGLRRVVDSHYLPASNSPLATRAPAEAGIILGDLHPNPASETATLSYQLPAGTATATLVLYDLTGRRVVVQVLQEAKGEAQLSVRGLATGFYRVALEVAGRPIVSRKLAITH